jgi:hypothetical protein
MLAYSHYRTNPEVICINQDVPTCFYAVQRRRLPIIAMLLDRGLSDTNKGEVNQNNYINECVSHKYFVRFLHVFLPRLRHWSEDCRQLTRNSSRASPYRVGLRLLAVSAKG